MGWWRRVNDVLKKEPETWLEYLYGQRFHDLKHLQDAVPRYQGPILRSLIYVYTLLRQTRLRFSPQIQSAVYLAYAGTLNQLSALESTASSLRDKGQLVVVVVPRSLISKDFHVGVDCHVMSLSVIDCFRVLTLTTIRFFTVLRSIGVLNPDLIRNRLDAFFQPHIYLIYFDRLLAQTKPKYVIVSNDHNSPNRALLALARNRGCKTVYMQHASVSSVFPALNVDFAFLDGESSYETYLSCEGNQPPWNPLLESRQVILSGQKKALSSRKRPIRSDVVGLAVNALDSLTDLSFFVKHLSEEGIHLKVRWHPGLHPRIIENLKSSLGACSIEYSDPRTENVNDFLNSICALIAGNSSIHLESALCSVPAFYFEFSETDRPDYYGYVNHGLAIAVADVPELVRMLAEALNGNIDINADAVRYFSSTYGTEWQGREGTLVADSLVAIDTNTKLPDGVKALKLN